MDTKIIAAALRANGYYMDTLTNNLYMTAPFEKKSNVYGTQEYRLVNNILAQFPDAQFSIQRKSRKEVIPYDMMEKFISIMPDAAIRMEEYENVKLKSHAFRSPYKYVTNWFEKKYPNYGEFMVKDENGNVVWDIVELYKQAAKLKAADTETKKAPKIEVLSERKAS